MLINDTSLSLRWHYHSLQRRVVFFIRSISVCLLLTSAILGNALSAGEPARVADGTLRACQIVSVDQAWAVGDRGLILNTNDAGKTWVQQSQRGEYQLNAVVFSNPQQGIALGGSIEPYSHRSIATVLATQDGGKTWTSIPNSLPRLTGAQWIAHDHLLAWGDWSQLQQSALFESLDHGLTWAPRPIPCSHVQAAAVGANNSLLIIDRVGHAYFAKSGLDFQSLNIPSRPLEALRFCKSFDGMWWMGGDGAQLYRSRDGLNWENVKLPGVESDHAHISLAGMASHGNRLCLVGEPGNVVWLSEDNGNTWVTRPLEGTTANNAIAAWGSDLFLICGRDAAIRASRNGGKAWWTQHQCGGRSAVLQVASVYSEIGWDLLATVSLEQRRNASLLVLHEQQLQDRLGTEPELSARIQILGNSLSLQHTHVLSHFPVGSLASGWREFDLNYYRAVPDLHTNVLLQAHATPVHRIVQEIRTQRPDVVVYPDRSNANALETAASLAVEQALKLAANPEFQLFSDASGIPNSVWQPQKTLYRTTRPGLSFPKPMLLQNAGVVLGTVLADTEPMLDYDNQHAAPTQKICYRTTDNKSSMMRDPLEAVILDQSTALLPRTKPSNRLPSLMANCQLVDWPSNADIEPSSPFTSDRQWESKLAASLKEASPDVASSMLLKIAIAERRKGNWARWQSAIEMLQERDTASAESEAAAWEWMSHLGSEEVARVIQWQKKEWSARTHRDSVQTVKNLELASPFASPNSKESEVRPATYVASSRPAIASIDRDLNEFSKLLGRWPERMQPLRSEARWSWLIASRYQSMQRRQDAGFAGVQLNRSPSLFWPLLSPNVPTWQVVAASERSLQKELDANAVAKVKPSTSTLTWGKTNQRPFLDGDADEPMWQSALPIRLQDPWQPHESPTTMLWLSHDDAFLYIFSRSTEFANGSPQNPQLTLQKSEASKLSSNRVWDQLSSSEDHIRIRLDVDRDYSTWFEFAWSRSGATYDSCNEMTLWNPTWHIATKISQNVWTAEIAIPLEQLLEEKVGYKSTWADTQKTPWAVNAIRHIPNVTSLTLSPFHSDQMSVSEWQIVKD
jgi:photosystem II stability/assembly factor-like uncharacterized protein